ncbi:7863_t:CDS:1 [Paraglomus occultum]|uniref:7863_t:CDS:1 n=1 Tax=Paraglomus occultum TaxID=144539 RepID=A0A9N8WM58_9GLOM|nr:7863_t:CDS:1 [Paraglomus occultum]
MANWITCSADSISRLTNPQIQYIIDYVTSKIVNNVNDQTSDSGCGNTSKGPMLCESSSEINLKASVSLAFQPKQTLTETELSILSEKVSPEIRVNAFTEETKSRVSDSSTSVSVCSKNFHDSEGKRVHVTKMVQERFPHLSLGTVINTVIILYVQEYARHVTKSMKTRIYGEMANISVKKPIDLHAGNLIIGEFQ